MKRNISKKAILLILAGLCVLGVCTCGDSGSSDTPALETHSADIPEADSAMETVLDDTQEEELPVLGKSCSLDDFFDQPTGMEFVFTGIFWNTRKDDYGYDFSYKKHNENGSTISQTFYVRDDTEDTVLSVLDDESDRGKAAVKMEVVFNKAVFLDYDGSDTIKTIYYVTAKKAEILDPASAEAKEASGNYFAAGDTIRFTNGLVVTIVDTGKYEESNTVYAYVEIEAENQGDSDINIGNGSVVFYGDDYRLSSGYPTHSGADCLSGAVIASGRKNRGRMYAVCQNYNNLTRIEMEFNDCVIVVKDDEADHQKEDSVEYTGQVPKGDINYLQVYDYAFGEVNANEEYGSYCLWDLDGNGVYELILGHGENSADYVNDIWTVGEEGGIVGVGCLYGDYSFYAAPDGNGIYAVYGNMGYESITRVIIKDGKFTEELIGERELGPDDEYYSSEMAISSADLDDRSLLERF